MTFNRFLKRLAEKYSCNATYFTLDGKHGIFIETNDRKTLWSTGFFPSKIEALVFAVKCLVADVGLSYRPDMTVDEILLELTLRGISV